MKVHMLQSPLWIRISLLIIGTSALPATSSPAVELFRHNLDPGTEAQQEALRRLAQRTTTLRATRAEFSINTFDNPKLNLNPFPEFNLEANSTPIGFSGTHHPAWFGTLTDHQGSAVFILNDEQISGKINSTHGTFEIFPLGKSQCVIVQHKTTSWPGCGTESQTTPSATPTPNPAIQPPAVNTADTPSVTLPNISPLEDGTTDENGTDNHVRVLVAYTAGAKFKTKAIYGRTMQEHVDLAIAESNQGYANSKVNLRLELACLYQTGFLETTAIENDVEDFRNNGDGKGDEVHQLRTDFDADMCCLLTDGRDYSWCGWSYGFDYTSRENMFQATSYACATGSFSFVHEFGHTQGCRHNDDLALTPFPYGHGYRKDTYWTTIMALPNNTTAIRLNYWSNPEILSPMLPHTPMGTPIDGNQFANDCCSALNAGSATVMNHETTPEDSTAPTNHSFDRDEFVDKTVTGTLSVATFSANQGSRVRFQAGSRIVLQPGFHAQPGSDFQASLTPHTME